MSGEVEWCPILHVRPKFDVFTLYIVDAAYEYQVVSE